MAVPTVQPPRVLCTSGKTESLSRLPAYMPELDGLRAVAILTVVFFHLQLPYCSLGWGGVNLFFVLSGFLITGILLESKQHQHYFRTFYIRRTLRIFPIYYLTLFSLAVLAKWKGLSIRDVGWFLLYGQNYLLGVKSWVAQFPAAFNHSWSLAVEEQFYLLWPLAVFLLSRRSLVGLCVILIVGAPACRLWVAATTHNPNLAFTPLACTADSLAIGALLSIYYHSAFSQHRTKSLGYLFAGLGGLASLGIIIPQGLQSFWSPNYLSTPSVNHLLFTVMGLFFAGCIMIVLQPKSIWSWILCLPFLRHLGRISYGLYMYHWPVLLFLPMMLKGLGLTGLRIRYSVPLYLIATYLIALGSWHLLEKRVNGLKRYFEY